MHKNTYATFKYCRMSDLLAIKSFPGSVSQKLFNRPSDILLMYGPLKKNWSEKAQIQTRGGICTEKHLVVLSAQI